MQAFIKMTEKKRLFTDVKFGQNIDGVRARIDTAMDGKAETHVDDNDLL